MEPWSRAWRDAQQAKEFYRQLFEQQQPVANDRETYELVWGFARVSWSVEGLKVNHPLFTSVVDVVTGEDNSLVVSPVEPLEVETLPFADVTLADRAALGVVREYARYTTKASSRARATSRLVPRSSSPGAGKHAGPDFSGPAMG